MLEQQKSKLVEDIVFGNNKNYFKTVDLECGTGKTLTSEEAFAKMVSETNKSAIFVRMTNENCRESATRINDLCNNECAFVFNNEDLTRNQQLYLLPYLTEYRVLCITHQKYLSLSRCDRRSFTKGRNILVIDEFPTDVITMKLDLEYIRFYKLFFKSDPVLYEKYCKIISGVEHVLLSNENERRSFVKKDKPGIKKAMSEFIHLIKANVSSNYLQDYPVDAEFPSVYSGEYVGKTILSLCNQIDNIRQFYGRVCVFANNTIYTSDTRYARWFLDNNILLDASGSLQSAYDLDKNTYHLDNLEPVLDHHQWTIINIVANTTTSGKEKMQNFYEVVNRILSQNKDCLLVCKKDEMHLFQCKYKSYFGNITGSNEFRNLKDVVIAHTPNTDDIQYIIRYLHYNRTEIENCTLISKKVGTGLYRRWQFEDPKFERIRESWMAKEIYQAIKRVNRQMVYSTNCFLFCNNENVVSLISEKLKNCQVEVVDDIGIKFDRTKKDEYIESLQNRSYANQFIKLLAELQDGKHVELLYKDGNKKIGYNYKKKDLCEYLGLNNTNFSHQIGNNTEVIYYCNERQISMSGHYVVIPDIKIA